MKLTLSHIATAGVLCSALALSIVSPASAHDRGRLKADKRALHQDHHDLNFANTRAERKAARIDAIGDRATLDQQRILIKGQDRQLHLSKRQAHLARLSSLGYPTPRDVYHARF